MAITPFLTGFQENSFQVLFCFISWENCSEKLRQGGKKVKLLYSAQKVLISGIDSKGGQHGLKRIMTLKLCLSRFICEISWTNFIGISSEPPLKLFKILKLKYYLITWVKPCDSLHLPLVHGIAAELQIPGKTTSIKVLFYVVSTAPKRSAFVSCVFAHSLNKIVKKKHQLPTICFLFGKTHFSYRNLTSGISDILFFGSFYVGSLLVGNAWKLPAPVVGLALGRVSQF